MTSPRFCSSCGTALNAGARFCRHCGRPIQGVPSAPVAPSHQPPVMPAPRLPPPPPVQQAYSPVPAAPPIGPQPTPPEEPIVNTIPGLNRHKGFLGLGVDSYTLVLTPGRMIFVYLDANTMKALVNEARAQAKAQGKGALGQWAAQMGWLGIHVERLQAMSPAAILAQFPGSFFIPNSAVSKVRVKRVSTSSDDSNSSDRTEVHVDSTAGKFRFVLVTGISHRELKRQLQQTLGAVVR